jgi:uracil-DNA glycosylase family 4
MLAALDWYRAAGVDLAVEEMPVDRFAASQAAPRPKPTPAAAAAPAPVVTLETDLSQAHALAAAARTLDELKLALEAYDGCPLKLRATQIAFSDGNPEADIMLVGEAPGAEEDRLGKPFVGKAGQLLDRMLASIGLDRGKVYITNMVPWRPPGNREPSPQEILSCQPFLFRQIELVAPRILLTVGGVSTKALLSTNQGILRMRGQWRELSVNGHSMQVMPILHPAYLLRQPAAKQQAWRDMLSLKRALQNEI